MSDSSVSAAWPVARLHFWWSSRFRREGLLSTVALLPMAGLTMITSGLAPRLAERAGTRATMTTGIFLTGVGLALLATLVSVDGGYLAVLPGTALGVALLGALLSAGYRSAITPRLHGFPPMTPPPPAKASPTPWKPPTARARGH